MKNNFRTLTSGILTKASMLFPKKEDVYTKDETYSKDEVDKLPPIEHEHSYLGHCPVSVNRPLNDNYPIITYGNGKFVIVSRYDNVVAYSEDGITWTEIIMPRDSAWMSVTYGNGKFVAACSDYYRPIAYSEDGITWTETNLSISDGCASVTYGNGKFVAVSWHGNEAAYSEDGITWTKTSMPIDSNWTSVTYGNGKFVAVGNSNKAGVFSAVAYSEDGITWTETNRSVYMFWGSVTYGNGKFVVFSNGDNVAAYSEDGITWTETIMPRDSYWESATYGNGKFVAVGNYGGYIGLYNAAAYSEDGITWAEISMPTDSYWTSVTYGNGKFVAVACYSDKVAYSYDGITWYDTYDEFTQDGEVIDIATEGYVDRAIPTSLSQLTNDAGYITAEDLPTIPEGPVGSTPSIIDVVELPTENIREDVWYRLVTGSLVIGQYIQSTYTVYCVETLPETGEPATNADSAHGVGYYVVSSGEVFSYVDENLSAALSVSAGWYDSATLLGAMGLEYGGIITDITDALDDDKCRLLLTYDFYTYKNEWVKTVFASEKAPKYNITWDGDMNGRPALDMSMLGYDTGMYFVKVSDDVFTTDELIGWRYIRQSYDGGIFGSEIDNDMLDTQTYPGAFAINDYIIVVYDADVTASALGIPTGIYTNGIYFWLYTDSAEGGYVSNLTSPVRITKIGEEYLDTITRREVEDMIDYVVNDVIYGAIGGSY